MTWHPIYDEGDPVHVTNGLLVLEEVIHDHAEGQVGLNGRQYRGAFTDTYLVNKCMYCGEWMSMTPALPKKSSGDLAVAVSKQTQTWSS